MFSRHLCSYKALLLNDGYTPIGSVCFKSRSDCSKMFIMEHFCSNDSISNIVFIILDNALDLAYCAASEIPPSILKHRYYFPGEFSVDGFGVVVG